MKEKLLLGILVFCFSFPISMVADHQAKMDKIRVRNQLSGSQHKPAVRFASTATALKADFSAQETATTISRNGFDKSSELQEWTLEASNRANTWMLGNSRSYYLPDFSDIDSKSISSLVIRYDENVRSDERLWSPLLTVGQGTSCSFYAAYDGVFVSYANFQVSVYDVATKSYSVLLDAANYASLHNLTRPQWIRYEYSLAAWAGKDVKICFHYEGIGGDDVLVDDFRIEEKDDSETATAKIDAGDQIHFINMSEGAYWYSNWTFEGGVPATSSDDNPVVTYPLPGSYPVTLTISDNTDSSVVTREGFVTVSGKAPVAKIGYPEGSYTEAGYFDCFVPMNTDLTFTDLSSNVPFSRSWYFEHADNEVYADEVALVRYSVPGVHKISLTATNELGSSTADEFVKVGGESDVCNFSRSESDNLDVINLGFYGYYGGTNWLDMPDFAELYAKPAAPVTIRAIKLYFSKTEAISQDALITVSICPEVNGLPGNALASSALPVGELIACTGSWIPTIFTFPTPVTMDQSFFVTFSGFPNQDNGSQADDIAVAAVRRQQGEKCTAYHNLSILDDNYQPTGETQWYKNADEAVSFAVMPVLEFNDVTDVKLSEVTMDSDRISVYTPQGIFMGTFRETELRTKLDRGCYILKSGKHVRKVMIE